ncbi:hypothetical protein [Enterococcus rotai]|uniref:hypothetical protein n=1 Tax=Enterococcus rotai TaxID=118060 RepID=UPI0035C76CF9
MKKIITVLVMLFILVGCGNSTEKERDFNQTNTEVKEGSNEEIAELSVISENQIKKLYGIDNIKINYTTKDFKVFRMPDDKNAETGEVYKNVYSGIGDFTWQDKIYHFSILYSMVDDSKYNVLSLTSQYDTDKIINVPLESDK